MYFFTFSFVANITYKTRKIQFQMKIKFYIFVTTVFIFVSQIIFAQSDVNQLYYHGGARLATRTNVSETEITPNSTGQSGTGANIDVIYHRIWWRINPDSSKGIKGNVTTYFKTIASNVSSITMDLRQSAFNNASLIVTYHGTNCTRVVSAANVLTITLPSTIATIGTVDSLVINYAGVPPAVVGAAQGYQKDTDPSTGQSRIYTLSESYEDRDWWPCKADMKDKVDSMDISVNVPWGTPTVADTFWVACNGKLVDAHDCNADEILNRKLVNSSFKNWLKLLASCCESSLQISPLLLPEVQDATVC